MIENARLSILGGGYYHCTPKWNVDTETGFKFGEVFGFWLPVSGGATMETTGGKCRLSPGSVYFISGHHMVRQICEKEMSVYWTSFVSESYYLHHRLMGIQSLHSWPLASVPWVEPVFRRMAEYYLPPETEGEYGPVRDDLPASLAIQLEAVMMHLTGILLESTDKDFHWGDHTGLERIKLAIDFMDEHYLRNPSLAEIAAQINRAPNYFHRAFKKETGITPFRYMENRRLDLARKLLFDQRLNITEVARKSGYDRIDYFSRAFRRRFDIPPSRLRQAP